MGISLRIDVDNPFGYATVFRKFLNRISLDYDVIPRWSSLGYLEYARALRDYLDDRSVPATWFFRNITAPKREDMDAFRKGQFDLALHAERTDTLENFENELDEWRRRFGSKPDGFSKHGSGDLKLSRRHVMEYDAEAFIDFGVQLGFEYFSGNGTSFEEGFEIRNGFVFVPGIFWLDNLALHPPGTPLDSLIECSESNNLIVLVHPFWWATQSEVKARLEKLISQVDFQTILELVRQVRRNRPLSEHNSD